MSSEDQIPPTQKPTWEIVFEWLKPRNVFALIIYTTFVVGFLNEMISADAMVAAFATIVAFYFGEEAGKRHGGK